ncbi:phosphoglycerate mutase-like protein [Bimuria novae-zelandiae CBS 107.79]|uniref:Phosphoglycerate mutase-like protein n=1 Tax=Bimuria novae-zelandiae CBS 107.79 TaxID=1447943 RepID=A0A6A5VMA4_9PLEO|nr:phosphoglycerate mutase-like protein [Bimuria novae-zelandiae CBS 107.79]
MPPIISSRVIAIIAGTVVLLFALLWTSCPNCPSTCSSFDDPHSGYLQYTSAERPHQASWGSWHHPKHSKHGVGQRASAVTQNWNILYHLGGNGPWVEKVDDVVEGGIGVPEGCNVEQVHMMSRHAERYPTRKVALRLQNLVKRMRESGVTFKGDMSFFNDWELFWSDDSLIEQLTSTGPFSGTLGAFTTGQALSRHRKIRYWASDCQRVIDTARHFGAGFFGLGSQNITELEVISEDSSMGANTLTPGDTCLTYVEDKEEGHDNGYTMLFKFRSTYLGATRERLLGQNPEFEFTEDEIYAMQEACGFETTVRGRSHWCDLFTREEFVGFEYARDILHYYRAGPGTPYGALLGWLWLNATTNLMVEGPSAGSLFFSFVHDGDIAPMIAALDIITDAEHLPTTHIAHTRKWKKSQVSPMGGRTTFELLSCELKEDSEARRNYVRININDGITALPDCASGPGSSCPLEQFVARTAKKGQEVGDFRQRCGLGDDAADHITFLHQ